MKSSKLCSTTRLALGLAGAAGIAGAVACSQGAGAPGEEPLGEQGSAMTTLNLGGTVVQGWDRDDLDWDTLSDTCPLEASAGTDICMYVNRVNAYDQAGIWARASAVDGFPYRWLPSASSNNWKYVARGDIAPGTYPYGKCHAPGNFNGDGDCPNNCEVTMADGTASPWGSECAGFISKSWGIKAGGTKGYTPNIDPEQTGRVGGAPAFQTTTAGWTTFASPDDMPDKPLPGDAVGGNSHILMYWGGDTGTDFISAECLGCKWGCGIKKRSGKSISQYKWVRLSDDILADVQAATTAAGGPQADDVNPFWNVVFKKK